MVTRDADPATNATSAWNQEDFSLPLPDHQGDMLLVLPDCWEFSFEAYEQLAALNDNLKIERTAEGWMRIVGSPGTFGAWSGGNLFGEIMIWAREHGGLEIGPDNDIRLGNTSILRPDCGWMNHEQAQAYWSLDRVERGRALPFVPAVVVEVRSPGQSVASQRRKMEEWMANGAQLAWLVDPIGQDVYVYRAGERDPERLHQPETLSGGDVMVGFELPMGRIWKSSGY